MIKMQNWIVAVVFIALNIAQAQELFVNGTSGNDNVTYSNNSAATPWRTLGRAVWGGTSISAPNASQAARAGDTVIVAAGTYGTSATTNSRYTPIYNPVNSGNSGAPITFRANGNVYLTASAGAQPIIGTYRKNHIVWDGFILNEANIPTTPDTGPLVVWESSYVSILNNHIMGRVINWGDNHVGIRVEYADNITVANNRIEGFNDAGMNAAGIMTYDVFHSTFEHNECFNCSTGIFIKGDHPGDAYPQHDIVVRYNYIHDTDNAIQFGVVGSTTSSSIPPVMSYIYQNLLTNIVFGGIIFISYDGVTPAKVTVANNTLNAVGSIANGSEAGGILLRPDYNGGYRELFFRNNLVTNGASGVTAWNVAFNAVPGATTFSHNNYFGNRGGAAYIAYRAYSLGEWQATFAKDVTGTTAVNPQYLSATDFRLASTSPVRTTGLDILDLNGNGSTTDSIPVGAYITGNETMGPTIGSPTPPTVTSALTANGTVGTAFTYQITGSNTPTSFQAAGLPAGLSINTSTGIISGTPAAAGSSSVTISASNAGGTGTAVLTITVSALMGAPAVTSSLTATGTTGSPFSYQITGSNSPTSFNATGLPAGLTVNSTTGVISGTPTVAGTTNVLITVTNAAGSGSATLVITVMAPPVIVPTLAISNATVTEGSTGTTSALFTVTLSTASTQTITVSYATANNTATLADSDYVQRPSTLLTFAPGGSLTQTVTVLVNGDTIQEANETFFVNLSSPVNATLADNQGLGTISNDDGTVVIDNQQDCGSGSGSVVGLLVLMLGLLGGLPLARTARAGNMP